MLILLLAAGLYSIGQKHSSDPTQHRKGFSLEKNKKTYEGYVIIVLPAIPGQGNIGNYRFDILENNQPVFHQVQTLLPYSKKGIQNIEDAYKIAEWMVIEFKKTGRWENTIQPHVMHQLKIDIL